MKLKKENMSDKKKSKKSENDKSEKLEHFDIKINEFGGHIICKYR